MELQRSGNTTYGEDLTFGGLEADCRKHGGGGGKSSSQQAVATWYPMIRKTAAEQYFNICSNRMEAGC